jgi:hypothetical protein
MKIGKSLSEARPLVPIHKILEHQQWPGLHRLGNSYCLYRQGERAQRFIMQDRFHWYDAITGKVGDSFDLFCFLRGFPVHDQKVIEEFLSLAGLSEKAGNGSDSSHSERENVGKDDADNVSAAIPKRKTPNDLLALIPDSEPILQADLFKTARAAGINEKYARRFVRILISEKQVAVRKILRSKAKSALGYLREPLATLPVPY